MLCAINKDPCCGHACGARQDALQGWPLDVTTKDGEEPTLQGEDDNEKGVNMECDLQMEELVIVTG